MSVTLRYALVGTGMMGHEHLRNLALLRDRGVADVEVVALVDPDRRMRESALALAHALGNRRARAHAQHRALDARELDAIVLASPNHTHRVLLDDLLPLGRAVLAEKPLATSAPDCRALLARLAEHRAPFWVAMEYRYMPPTARFIERVADGAVGRLRMLSIREHRYPFLDKVGRWNRFSANTGGTLVEKCCHHFDLMRLIVGREAVRVYASGAQDVNHLDERVDGRVPDILDNALVVVDFDGGVRASLELCMFAEGAEPQEQITAIGDAGKLDVCIPPPDRFRSETGDWHASLALFPRAEGAPVRERFVLDPELAAAGDHHGSTYHQHERFARAALGDGPVEVSAADGAAAVRLGLAAQESIRTGRAVTLDGAT